MKLVCTSGMHHSVENFTPERVIIEGKDKKEIVMKAIKYFLEEYEGAFCWSIKLVEEAFKDISSPIKEPSTDIDTIIVSMDEDEEYKVAAWWRLDGQNEENIGFGPSEDGVKLDSKYENHWISFEEMPDQSKDRARLMEKSKEELVEILLEKMILGGSCG